MTDYEDNTEMIATIDRWFEDLYDPGDWVGVFENHDLGHRDLGTRVAFLFDSGQWDQAKVGKTRAPDGSTFGLGWRYILVAKCETREETVAALTRFDCDYCGPGVWEHMKSPRWGETEWYREVHGKGSA